jgi:DNA-binding MarR family transcriptional regulator
MDKGELKQLVDTARDVLMRVSRELTPLDPTDAQMVLPEPEASADLAREMLRQRRERDIHFPARLFAEREWDLLLTLYIAHCDGNELRQLDLFTSIGAPHSTATRILGKLVALGLAEVRVGDTLLRKRIVRLTPKSAKMMSEYFAIQLQRAAGQPSQTVP